ncbi:hypothetical protein EV356DRAFT_515080 [Viridothelium virens]|uniref:Uncharacterized protein n=1 Tax=Viridothelium virens TaxID=1048519 RepID=A0A6A6H9B8_VIRVR|nr:hypothetical protein EV356DRAFT_515080 [Viridothelium virens]
MPGLMINDLPYEILSNILAEAAKLNAVEGVTWTFGLTEPELPHGKIPIHKYVRGPVQNEIIKWDSVTDIRQTCSVWRNWALSHALEQIHLNKWRTSERWAEVTRDRSAYNIYELIDRPSGAYVRQPPYLSLDKTCRLFSDHREIARHVRRIWFNGFYVAETDQRIFDTVNECSNLHSVAIPWTMLRRGNADDWARLLRANDKNPLQSLELLGVEIPQDQKKRSENQVDKRAPRHHRVDFSQLKRLKVFGNTTFMPVCDDDLQAIARTATGLEEIHISCLSTISIKGLIALIQSSRNTLRVIEHAPRSSDGFIHCHPGELEPDSSIHLCELLTSCPNLRDLSLSMPTVCAELFSNHRVKWSGELQVRALSLCTLQHKRNVNRRDQVNSLSKLLSAARDLSRGTAYRHCASDYQQSLSIEFFMSHSIFTPLSGTVHGDFSLARISSNNLFPREQHFSFKGPYGSSGVYGKQLTDEEIELWEVVGEQEYLVAMDSGWVSMDI